jgi:hypothetical protein
VKEEKDNLTFFYVTPHINNDAINSGVTQPYSNKFPLVSNFSRAFNTEVTQKQDL